MKGARVAPLPVCEPWRVGFRRVNGDGDGDGDLAREAEAEESIRDCSPRSVAGPTTYSGKGVNWSILLNASSSTLACRCCCDVVE